MERIDDARLAGMRAALGPEDFALVVEALLEEAVQAVAGLAQLISGRPDAVRDRQLRYLAGAARNLGAVELAELCGRHERAGAFIQDDHAQLHVAVRAICAAFADRVGTASRSAA